MHGQYDADFHGANPSTAPVCSAATIRSPDCKDVQDPLWFGLLCRSIWPSKPWLMLQQIAGCKERTAYNYAAGSCPPADVLRDILLSDDGEAAMEWMAKDGAPKWWLRRRRDRELAALAIEIFKRISAIERSAP
jgi:hypothetical protein